jgi:hypothetical protein
LLILTKPNPVLADDTGRCSKTVETRFNTLFGLTQRPEARRLREGEKIEYAGLTLRPHRLPDGVSEFDDACLDYSDGCVVEVTNEEGGRALLLGCALSSLSFGEELHRLRDQHAIRLLHAALGTHVSRQMSCTNMQGEEDFATFGLVRQRKQDTMATAHRVHDAFTVIRAGRAVIYVPEGPRRPGRSGANIFVHHVEEPCHVVYNPFDRLLRTIDLGRKIRGILSYDRQWRYVHFEGSMLRLALPPRREMRFAAIEFGERDVDLPSDIAADDGDILEAHTSAADPGRTLIRVRGPERFTIRMSLAARLGRIETARCLTTQEACETRVVADDDRLQFTGSVKVIPTIENDVEILQRP